jgi:hypothetical protein
VSATYAALRKPPSEAVANAFIQFMLVMEDDGWVYGQGENSLRSSARRTKWSTRDRCPQFCNYLVRRSLAGTFTKITDTQHRGQQLSNSLARIEVSGRSGEVLLRLESIQCFSSVVVPMRAGSLIPGHRF